MFRSATLLRSSRDCHSRPWSISPTLDVRLYLCRVNLAARRCTPSSFLIRVSVCGFQTVELYSRIGLTSDWSYLVVLPWCSRYLNSFSRILEFCLLWQRCCQHVGPILGRARWMSRGIWLPERASVRGRAVCTGIWWDFSFWKYWWSRISWGGTPSSRWTPIFLASGDPSAKFEHQPCFWLPCIS